MSAVNAKLESFSKKKGRKGSSYDTSIHSRFKEEVGKYAYNNEHKLQLIASNQSTHNTLFYVHVLTIGNANSITRKEICYYQSSANVEDLMS